MSSPIVYLSGPITGLSLSDVNDWRRLAAQWLQKWGIETLDPMRGKGHSDYLHPLSGTMLPRMEDGRSIVARDRFDVIRSDVILANLTVGTGEFVSIGTMIELGWADAMRKPIVLVKSSGPSQYEHPFLEHIPSVIVPTIDGALVAVRGLLIP